MSAITESQETIPGQAEAGVLAREMAAAFGGMVEWYTKHYKLSAREAVAKAEEAAPPAYEEHLLRGPPDQVSWHGLHELARRDPALAQQRWEEVKQAALDELRSGHRAAMALEGSDPSCWKRAQFLAIRQELSEQWQPRDGLERQLLDTMAQVQASYRHWLELLTLRSTYEVFKEQMQVHDRGRWEPPRTSDTRAIDQAAAMVERFNRIFLRTLRAFQDLRRGTPAVIVQNAKQVNVGGLQVNLQVEDR